MKRILCIGDSNTWGYDPRSYLGSQYPDNIRWTGQLEQSGWTVINFGQNGLAVPRKSVFPVLEKQIRNRLPLDTVTVMLGSNDLLEGAGAEETAGRMEPFIHFLTATAEKARTVLIAPPVMKPGEWVQSVQLIEESRRLAGCYQKLAERAGVAFADAESWGVELAYDGVHFSPDGHRAFAEGIRKILGQ